MMKKRFSVNAGMICILLLMAVCFFSSKVQAATVNAIGASDYIAPDSSTEEYTAADIAGMSAKELNYARNEIFAKHGRKFTSGELQSYFESRSWYSPVYEPDEFDAILDSVVNEIEKKNVQLFRSRETELGVYTPGSSYSGSTESSGGSSGSAASVSSTAVTQIGTNSVSVDANNDGSSETVVIEDRNPNGYGMTEYCLYIGDAFINGSGEFVTNDIYAINVSGITYIVVYAEGPSDDPACTFYRYAGGQITDAGTIYCWPNDITADGNGTISAHEPFRLIQTDEIYESWTVGADGSLNKVSQDYYMFVTYQDYHRTCTTVQPITVYSEMSTSSSVNTIPAQTTVEIPCTDGTNWIYVSGGGAEGWFYCDRYGIGSTYFDGLFIAD